MITISKSWDFIGQEPIIKQILILIAGSKIQKVALSHLLLIGPPGMGKTTIAQLVAQELQANFHTIQGTSISKSSDIISILANIKPFDVVFIDEIHVINYEILEVLYSALEGNYINIMIGKDYNNKIVKINLPPFTFIGATNKVGMLTKALISRIPNIFQFRVYDLKDIENIIFKTIQDLKWNLTSEIIKIIAKSCRNIPRNIINLIKRLYNYCLVMKAILTVSNIAKILNNLEIYPLGLNRLELQYLNLFIAGKVIGIETIAQLLNEEIKNIEVHYEPWLMQVGLVAKTPKGRTITEKGQAYLIKNKSLF